MAAKKKVAAKKKKKKVVKKKVAAKKKVGKKKKKKSRKRFVEGHATRREKRKKRKKRVLANNPPRNEGAGRPTYYGPELLKLTEDYIKNYWRKYDDPVPSIAGLACVLGIPRERINQYAADEDKEEFYIMHRTILALQEKRLLSGGLRKLFDSSITKLMLGKHGYHDKQDSTLSGPDGGPVQSITRTVVDPKHKTKRGKKT